MDVETVFLNEKVKSEVYIHEPQGYETGKIKVCKLLETLYGLRQNPKAWYETFDQCVSELGFI